MILVLPVDISKTAFKKFLKYEFFLLYIQRLKNWEGRERKKTREYEKENEREDERKSEEVSF